MYVCEVCGSLNTAYYKRGMFGSWLCQEHAIQRGVFYTRGI